MGDDMRLRAPRIEADERIRTADPFITSEVWVRMLKPFAGRFQADGRFRWQFRKSWEDVKDRLGRSSSSQMTDLPMLARACCFPQVSRIWRALSVGGCSSPPKLEENGTFDSPAKKGFIARGLLMAHWQRCLDGNLTARRQDSSRPRGGRIPAPAMEPSDFDIQYI